MLKKARVYLPSGVGRKNRHTHHHLHKSSGEIALAMLCQQSLAVHHKPPVKTTQFVAISRFAGFAHKPTFFYSLFPPIARVAAAVDVAGWCLGRLSLLCSLLTPLSFGVSIKPISLPPFPLAPSLPPFLPPSLTQNPRPPTASPLSCPFRRSWPLRRDSVSPTPSRFSGSEVVQV